MQISPHALAELSDDDLIATVKRCTADERRATAQLVAALSELDARRLYLGAGCASLFAYCVQVLHLSEHAAYNRIEAARAARRFPVVLERLAEGAITLTGVRLLAPHFTAENVGALLDAARHTSKRDLDVLVASVRPQPAVPSAVRKLPSPPAPPSATASASLPATLLDAGASVTEMVPAAPAAPALTTRQPSCPPPPAARAIVQPLAPERYKIQMTVSGETVDKLRRAQDLLRHAVPSGDPAAIVDRALTALLVQLEKTKLAVTDRPRASRGSVRRTRSIPAAVRREVWRRDAGRCSFVGSEGRCTERGFLQFHHLVPYVAGGEATVETVALRCAAHNRYEAELEFTGGRPMVVRELRDVRCGRG